jgi:predicted acylesterase/phospholipase RssA
MSRTFSNIVIAGGAVKAISTIGCIKYLEEHDMMKSLRNYVGTSAGSIMCFFLILGYKSHEIQSFLEEHLYDSSFMRFEIDQILNFFHTYGISNGVNLTHFFEKILYKKLKVKDITFIDLAKIVGKNLVVCASNLTTESAEFLSVDSVPSMSVIMALRMSCSIPYLFSPVYYNECIFVDGALYNNFPIEYFNIKDRKMNDTIGLNIVNKNYQQCKDFISYSMFMINSVIKKINQKDYTDIEKNIITIEIEDTEWFSIKDMKILFPREKIKDYIDYGYSIIKNNLQKSSNLQESSPSLP